jgi:hypothetical protein
VFIDVWLSGYPRDEKPIYNKELICIADTLEEYINLGSIKLF